MVTVRIPTALRTFAGNQARAEVPAKTVGEALAGLVEAHPDLRKHLYEDGGQLRSFVNVFLGDTDVRTIKGQETPVADSDTLLIVPSVAGGRA